MAALLEVVGVSKRFGGVTALDQLSFTLAVGERLAIIGPNGAGKSTLFGCLGGQLRPDSGDIWLDGASIVGVLPHRRWRHGLGRTFQTAAAFTSMTALEALQLVLLNHHRRLWRPWVAVARCHRQEALALLAQLDLVDLAPQPCAALAYGDLKRLELALAIAHHPRLLLMDEPTAGVEAEQRQQLMGRVLRLAEERQMALLFTEHDMGVVFDYSQRVLVLDRGRLIADGPPELIRTDPQVIQIYLGSEGGGDG